MKPLLEKCAELKMPVNVHVAEDEWMYLPADSTNDGLMNAAKWKVDLTKKGILNHDQLIATLENAVRIILKQYSSPAISLIVALI